MNAQTEASFARELKALRLLVEQTREGVLAFGLYSDVKVRDEAVDWLHDQSSLPVHVVRLSTDVLDLAEVMRSFGSGSRACFEFVDIEAAFPKILGYINFKREVLLQAGQALVFWIREEGLRRIAEEAPDLWAWRSSVFDFRTVQDVEYASASSVDPVIGHYDFQQLTTQAEALEESGATDLVSQLDLGRRLFSLGRYKEADIALRRAVEESERRDDQRGLAQALVLLGDSKFEQGLLEEASLLAADGLAAARRLGFSEELASALRLSSGLAQVRRDPDLAYQAALEMMSVAKAIDNPALLVNAYDQMGNVLVSKRDLRGAEQAFLSAVQYEEQVNFRFALCSTLLRLAEVYKQMGALTQAAAALSRASEVSREAGFSPETIVLADKLE